jgi:hypothetical protein
MVYDRELDHLELHETYRVSSIINFELNIFGGATQYVPTSSYEDVTEIKTTDGWSADYLKERYRQLSKEIYEVGCSVSKKSLPDENSA